MQNTYQDTYNVKRVHKVSLLMSFIIFIGMVGNAIATGGIGDRITIATRGSIILVIAAINFFCA